MNCGRRTACYSKPRTRSVAQRIFVDGIGLLNRDLGGNAPERAGFREMARNETRTEKKQPRKGLCT
jgi:hypothetical protein